MVWLLRLSLIGDFMVCCSSRFDDGLRLLIASDSIYTERYMHTPQHNPKGYDNTSIHDVESLAKNVRFLVMHGVADDNVHTQSTYTLLDKLDLAGVENYDVHIFPDSDHGIYFHNANKIVYDSRFTSQLIVSSSADENI
jgi:dipeptidyl aminopeptidase